MYNVHMMSASAESYDGTRYKWDCEVGLLVGEPWKGPKGENIHIGVGAFTGWEDNCMREAVTEV
jgi:hypothetical protein